MKQTDFNEWLSQASAEAEAVLETYLPDPASEPKTARLAESMRYACLSGGKRLRPVFLLETCRYFGGDAKAAGPFAAAIEMIHSFSLVHDDLPSMDNDTLRRGRPTTWAVYGDGFATVSGDTLSLYAFETAAKAAALGVPVKRVLRAIAELAAEAGLSGMCGGQALDMILTGRKPSEEDLRFLYRAKTGALLRASMAIGAILAGASEEEVETVNDIADHVGMAFQILDDYLDAYGDEAVIGKPVGSDEKNGKTTFATLYGRGAGRLVEEETEEALSLLSKLEEKRGEAAHLSALIRQLAGRDH